MTCDSAQELLAQDPAQRTAELLQHLDSCPACSKFMDDMTSLRNTVREQAPYYKAPPGLKRRILAQTRDSESYRYRWLAIAASVLLVTSLAGNIVLLRTRVTPQQALAANVVSSHIRSLAGTHLLDVESTDQHTVKPWFNGKLDFSPSVKDFAAQGFPLVGGRLEYFDGRAAAALVFERRKHIINLFTWPTTAEQGEMRFSRNGFNVLQWTQSGMTYWAVSDLNDGDLESFVALYHQMNAPPGTAR